MSFVLEHQEPILLFTININFNFYTASINLLRFIEIFNLTVFLKVFSCNCTCIHKCYITSLCSFCINIFSGCEIFFESLFYELIFRSFCKSNII